MRKVDELMRRMAGGRRHGVVRHEELVAAGATPRMIERRLESGFLVPAHRGVYVVNGPERPPLADHAAAVLACRPRALLSQRTILRLRGLPARDDGFIDVVVVGRKRRSPAPRVRTHFISHLLPAERSDHEGIPATSTALALLDVAGHGDAEELLACVHEARVQKLVSDRQLRATLAAHPNRRGARALRRLLESEGGVKRTRSEGERRLLRLMQAHGLDPDASDHRIGPYTVDFYFARERVAIEYDGRAVHDNPRRFVRDRRKIAYLAARGIVTVPFTAHDLAAGAERAMADLRRTLEERRG